MRRTSKQGQNGQGVISKATILVYNFEIAVEGDVRRCRQIRNREEP